MVLADFVNMMTQYDLDNDENDYDSGSIRHFVRCQAKGAQLQLRAIVTKIHEFFRRGDVADAVQGMCSYLQYSVLLLIALFILHCKCMQTEM